MKRCIFVRRAGAARAASACYGFFVGVAVLGAGFLGACQSGPRPPKGAAVTAAPATDFDPALLRRAGVDPAALRCNRDNRWGAMLRDDAKAGAADMMALLATADPALAAQPQADRDALARKLRNLLMWRMVRALLLEGDNNNLGVFPLRGHSYVDAAGVERPVLVFRSGITPDPAGPASCFRSLLEAGGVRHVVDLFDGEIPVADLVAAESATATAHGATYRTASDSAQRSGAPSMGSSASGEAGYGPWRELLRSHYDEPDKRQQAFLGVARLIREQILAPGGSPPKGNIHIHCGGGMHRSGMIAAVLERCINHEPMDVVQAHYRYHVGYKDAAHPGGAEEGNLRFIKEFDCGLLGAESVSR